MFGMSTRIRPLSEAAILTKQALDLIHVRQQILAALVQHQTVLRRLHLARGALQQACTEQGFQRLHMLGHRRARQPQAFAGEGETRQFADPDEGAQQFQFVHGTPVDCSADPTSDSGFSLFITSWRINKLCSTPLTAIEEFHMNRKIALITGASRGLGKNAALHLAAQGIDIIGTYHSRADEAQALVAELEATRRQSRDAATGRRPQRQLRRFRRTD